MGRRAVRDSQGLERLPSRRSSLVCKTFTLCLKYIYSFIKLTCSCMTLLWLSSWMDRNAVLCLRVHNTSCHPTFFGHRCVLYRFVGVARLCALCQHAELHSHLEARSLPTVPSQPASRGAVLPSSGWNTRPTLCPDHPGVNATEALCGPVQHASSRAWSPGTPGTPAPPCVGQLATVV